MKFFPVTTTSTFEHGSYGLVSGIEECPGRTIEQETHVDFDL